MERETVTHSIGQFGRTVAHMPAVWRLRLLQQLARWGVREETLLIVMAVVVGFGAAGAAWCFEEAVTLLQRHYFARVVNQFDMTGRWIWLLPLVPAAGGLLVSVVRWIFGHGHSPLHGLSAVMLSLIRNSGRLKHSLGLETLAASSLTIGTGGSAGPEAPIAIIGSSVGSVVASLAGISRTNSATLIGCGAAAGISAVFDAPIAGVLFALEVMLRDFSVRTFTPIVISAVIATTTFHAILGAQHQDIVRGLFEFQNATPIAFSFREIPNFLLLGIICGGLAIALTLLMDGLSEASNRVKVIPRFFHPALGALFSGVCGVILLKMIGGAGNPHGDRAYVPVFASGYATILQSLDPSTYAAGGAVAGGIQITLFALLALCIAKVLATGFTLGGGGSGGVFAPSLFIGATAGGAVGLVLRHVSPMTQPSTYALVGMGTVLAAIIQAPLMGIILLFELTRNYQVMLPIMIAAVTGTMLYRAVFRESLYTQPLRKMGVRAGSAVGVATLRRIVIDQMPLKPAVIARPNEPLSDILTRMQSTTSTDFVVLDSRERYLGMITAMDLRTVILAPESASILVVGEVMRSDVPPLTKSDTLESAWDLFSRYDINEIAVVGGTGAGTAQRPVIEGVISRGDVMRRYHAELG
jgi:CIC family chloride channel protein